MHSCHQGCYNIIVNIIAKGINRMEIEVKCTCCSKGCNLKIDEKNQAVSGNSCPRGIDYGISELEYIRRRAEKSAQECSEND
jgi:hypothetical protein